jgi:O-antigen/teichoic acid export membrane protein
MSIVSLSNNTIIYSIGTLSLRLTAFLLIPLYTRYLTKSEFGLLQILLFTIQVLITVNDMGMRTAIMRFFHSYESDKKLPELFGSSFSIIILVGFVLLTISLLLPSHLNGK